MKEFMFFCIGVAALAIGATTVWLGVVTTKTYKELMADCEEEIEECEEV